ncbi:MAG: pantoate--beta-alanine ligase [Syntrophales bacterium]
MEIVRSIKDIQVFSESLRNKAKKISLVPTMGYFHEGHLSLMREGKRRGDCLIISIYVNPMQFGPADDFARYPRDFERDRKLAESVGADIIFCPENEEMYPEHYQTFVDVEEVTRNLCGLSRPGHFRGVTTVCTKLFNIVKPHVAIFGRKDFQQFVTIKRMARDLNIDLEVVGIPTVREEDGLAMSSRNVYLKDSDRKSALSLSRSLVIARRLYEAGERNSGKILRKVKGNIEGEPCTTIDYASICDTATLKDVDNLECEAVLALAVKIGPTRLIDNYVFGEALDI